MNKINAGFFWDVPSIPRITNRVRQLGCPVSHELEQHLEREDRERAESAALESYREEYKARLLTERDKFEELLDFIADTDLQKEYDALFGMVAGRGIKGMTHFFKFIEMKAEELASKQALPEREPMDGDNYG